MTYKTTNNRSTSARMMLVSFSVFVAVVMMLVSASSAQASSYAYLGKRVASTERYQNPAPVYSTYCQWTPGAAYGFLIATPYGYACSGHQVRGSGSSSSIVGLSHRRGVWNNSLGVFIPQTGWLTGVPR